MPLADDQGILHRMDASRSVCRNLRADALCQRSPGPAERRRGDCGVEVGLQKVDCCERLVNRASIGQPKFY